MKEESGNKFGPVGFVPVERECKAEGLQVRPAHLPEEVVLPVY